MDPNVKKYFILTVVLVLLALLLPTVIALLGVVLSPVLTTLGFIALLFVVTVIIAYKNKIGR